MTIDNLVIGPDPIGACNHESTHFQVFDNSHEEWHNGVATWIEGESRVEVCNRCGAIKNPETGRWERDR